MPRAKPKCTPPYFEIKPFRLSAELQEELGNLLGFEIAVPTDQHEIQSATSRIEHYVGRYLGIAELAKELPGNASLIAELRAFLKRGDFSENAFNQLYPWLQHTFHDRGVDLSPEEDNSDDVIGIATEIIETLSGEHRGRPVNRPFQDLIKQLRNIFRGFRRMEIDSDALSEHLDIKSLPQPLDPLNDDDESFNEAFSANLEWQARLNDAVAGGGQTTRQCQGSVQNLSPVEADEYEFVTLILKAADIHVPKNLLDLFNRVGRAPQDRAEVLNQIAKRAKKRRQSPPC